VSNTAGHLPSRSRIRYFTGHAHREHPSNIGGATYCITPAGRPQFAQLDALTRGDPTSPELHVRYLRSVNEPRTDGYPAKLVVSSKQGTAAMSVSRRSRGDRRIVGVAPPSDPTTSAFMRRSPTGTGPRTRTSQRVEAGPGGRAAVVAACLTTEAYTGPTNPPVTVSSEGVPGAITGSQPQPGADTIMILRHREKPPATTGPHGTDANGNPSNGSLTVQGWQRAGALAQLLDPLRTEPVRPASGPMLLHRR
jgi:hypothetical protein